MLSLCCAIYISNILWKLKLTELHSQGTDEMRK